MLILLRIDFGKVLIFGMVLIAFFSKVPFIFF